MSRKRAVSLGEIIFSNGIKLATRPCCLGTGKCMSIMYEREA